MADETKVALLFGGSSPIGQATARIYAKNGYKLAIHGRNKERLDAIVAECNDLSPTGQKVSFDTQMIYKQNF